MDADASFAVLMERLQAHDADAAQRLFQAYLPRLVALARGHLDPLIRQRLDAEDVVQSVFKSFFLRQAGGQWQIDGWASLWALLAAITVNKCRNQNLKAAAARRDVRRECAPELAGDESGPAWDTPAADPTPDEAAMLAELVEHLLKGLPDKERQIVVLTLQGESIAEIARQAVCSTRKVYRVQKYLRNYVEHLRAAEE